MPNHYSRLLFLSPFLLLISACAPTHFPGIDQKCQAPLVLVSGYAEALVADTRLQNAKITWLEKQESFHTNQYGQFSFCAKPHEKMTLFIQKTSAFSSQNFYPTQTSSVYIPKNGLSGKYREITFQVPRHAVFNSLRSLMRLERHASMDKHACHVVVTVTDHHKTLADDPQGINGAKIRLWHKGKPIRLKDKPYYFGIILEKTNPFTPGRDVTSEDGGVLIFNLPVSRVWYRISAVKPGLKFTTAHFWCRPNTFINVSPPHSPSVIKPLSLRNN